MYYILLFPTPGYNGGVSDGASSAPASSSGMLTALPSQLDRQAANAQPVESTALIPAALTDAAVNDNGNSQAEEVAGGERQYFSSPKKEKAKIQISIHTTTGEVSCAYTLTIPLSW